MFSPLYDEVACRWCTTGWTCGCDYSNNLRHAIDALTSKPEKLDKLSVACRWFDAFRTPPRTIELVTQFIARLRPRLLQHFSRIEARRLKRRKRLHALRHA